MMKSHIASMAQTSASDPWSETTGSFAPDDFENFTIARIRFPEIAEQLSDLERLIGRQKELANQLDDLRVAKEQTDEDLLEVVREIRAHLQSNC